MSNSQTLDQNGTVVGETVSTNTVTVQYSRKFGRADYGNEEAGIFFQVDVTEDDDLTSIQGKVESTFAFAKTLVLNQLGAGSEVSDGVVRELPVSRPTAAPAAPRIMSAPAAADKTAMWQELVDSPHKWFDNRQDKKNPKAPDFKAKRTSQFDGQGLWADKMPPFAKIALEGLAAA